MPSGTPYYATAVEVEHTGTAEWLDPASAVGEADYACASVATVMEESSDKLVFNFAADLPLVFTPLGIKVEVAGQISYWGLGSASVQVDAGTETAIILPEFALGWAAVGGAANLMGLADPVAAFKDLRVKLWVACTQPVDALVDAIRVTLYYTAETREADERVEQFIFDTLTGEPDLMDLLPGGVHGNQAVHGAQFPCLVFNQQSGVDTGLVGSSKMNAYARYIYLVKSISQGKSFAPNFAIMALVDGVLNGAKDTASGILGLRRQGRVRYVENDGDRRYNHLGYLYIAMVEAP